MRLIKEIDLIYRKDQSAPRNYTFTTADSRVSKTISLADQPPMIRDAFLYGNIYVIHHFTVKSHRLVDIYLF